MKKLFYFTIFSLGLLITAYGQTRLSFQNNAYTAGDSPSFIVANNVNEGLPGSNQKWDFSVLTAKSEIPVQFLESNASGNQVNFPECNILLREQGSEFFFKVTENNIKDYGYSCPCYVVRYNNPIVKFVFPFTYGSAFSGKYQGDIIGQGNKTVSGEYATAADGYGTLILPGNVTINNVLRVKFTQKTDSISSWNVTYRWYANAAYPNLKYPLLTIMTKVNKDSAYTYHVAYNSEAGKLAVQQPVSQSVSQDYNSIDFESYNVKVFPNPFKENAQVAYTLPENAKVTLYISDNTGKIIQTLIDGMQQKGSYLQDFSIPQATTYYVITLVVNGKIICSKLLFHIDEI
ncbi:T9SS type A sorting domain-containing protein [Parabacteroides sp. FAFU027]|uniref:T9SS type A sorting domain-containing protein n=1 Tax=Parabacteroides sp. FAFU027 TaxID=2922715 RepID=UPI001FAEFAE6|nr:T9SS type A sorting domain-containing protein [Parabacteroides sp. FAFU027]